MKKNLLTLCAFLTLLYSCIKNEQVVKSLKVTVDETIKYGLGYTPSTKEQLSGISVYSKKDVESIIEVLPASYLLPVLPQALNQGSKGSCVGYAVAHARTIMNTASKVLANGQPDFNIYASGDYLYEKYKFNRNSCSNGVFFVDALDALKADGVCSYAEMPLVSCGKIPTEEQEKNIIKNRIYDYYRIADYKNINTLKALISQGFPVIISITVDYDFTRLNKNNDLWKINASASYGGHAVVLTGFDDNKQAFRLLNSWGSYWGDGGYCWVTYEKLMSLLRPDVFFMRISNDQTTYSGATTAFVGLNRDANVLYNNFMWWPLDQFIFMGNSEFNWFKPLFITDSLSKYANPSLILSYYVDSNRSLPTQDMVFEIRLKMKATADSNMNPNKVKGLEVTFENPELRHYMTYGIPVDPKEQIIVSNNKGEIYKTNTWYSYGPIGSEIYKTTRINIKEGSFVNAMKFINPLASIRNFTLRFIGTIGSVDDIKVYSQGKLLGSEYFDRQYPWLTWNK